MPFFNRLKSQFVAMPRLYRVGVAIVFLQLLVLCCWMYWTVAASWYPSRSLSPAEQHGVTTKAMLEKFLTERGFSRIDVIPYAAIMCDTNEEQVALFYAVSPSGDQVIGQVCLPLYGDTAVPGKSAIEINPSTER